MSLFFALSGFLIMRTLRSESVGEFVVKRLARILPLAYAYILFVFIAYAQHPAALLAGLGFVLNYDTGAMIPVTEHLWSLAVEVQFYAFTTVLALVGRRALLCVWPVCILVTVLRIATGSTLSIETHLRVDEILVGACVATLPSGSGFASAGWRDARLAQAAFLAAALVWIASAHPATGPLQYLRPYSAGLFLAMAATLPRCAIATMLSAPFPRAIAQMSYALYILHPLTAHGWWNEGGETLRYLVKRPIGLALTFAAARGSTLYFERPCIAAAKRLLAVRRSPIAVDGAALPSSK